MIKIKVKYYNLISKDNKNEVKNSLRGLENNYIINDFTQYSQYSQYDQFIKILFKCVQYNNLITYNLTFK